MSVFASLAALGVGFLFPAYKTLLAVEGKKEESKQDREALLKYWCVFGTFYFITSLFEVVLAFIPLYYYLRAAFIIGLATQDVLLNFSFDQLMEHYPKVEVWC